MSTGKPTLPPNRAASYVRMSTEHQQYSTSNQMDVVGEYAKRREFDIIREILEDIIPEFPFRSFTRVSELTTTAKKPFRGL